MIKLPIGITGLDDLLHGGFPKSKTTYILGTAGSGKTMLATQFLYQGALLKEPSLLVSFDESSEDIIDNFQSIYMDLSAMIEKKLLAITHIFFDENTFAESTNFTLDGLKLRLEILINEIGAKRVVLDSFETLFERFDQTFSYRTELSKLLHWLKGKGLTTVLTGGLDSNVLGIESYLADCVILLDQRVKGQISTRRIRVVKYRGSSHETNEYPFSITSKGLLLSPLSSINLNHSILKTRVSTGIPTLDALFGGKGFYEGSSILVSGEAGAGKSSLSAHFISSVCSSGKKAIMFLFEESEDQVKRNMLSIGIDLQPFIDDGLLKMNATRPTQKGLEEHLLSMIDEIDTFNPRAVVIDPISSFWSNDVDFGIKALITQIIDYFKSRHITGMFMHLMHGIDSIKEQDTMISSLIDTWVVLRNRESDYRHYRELFIVKSRGMEHNHSINTFKLTDDGFIIEGEVNDDKRKQ